jgi:hypothetical protein
MSEDPSNRFEKDRRLVRLARAENVPPWLRSISGPGFGVVLGLILAQLVFTLAAPAEEWASFVSVLLQALILWTAMVAARLSATPRRIGGALIASVVVLTGAVLLVPDVEIGDAVPLLITVALVFFTPLVIILGVSRSMRVEGTITMHVMFGVLSIYLLVGYAFALIFQVIGELDSANFFSNDAAESGANFLYFAFVTMTTVGYGDLAPAEGAGRAFSIALALIGQIYLVTVVAVIVSNLGARHSEPGT